MKIPTSNIVQGPQGAPSEAEMLMALAEMHRQGRIEPKPKAEPEPEPMPRLR